MKTASMVTLSEFKANYFEKFQKLFIREYGFYFAPNRMESFRKILTEQIAKSSHKTFEEFYSHLSSSVAGRLQFKTIMDEVTVGETYFFRNEPQLEVLKNHIIPKLIHQKRESNSKEIKIWSAGCSTGEEVYTLAIILLENIPNPNAWHIRILGTDINRDALEIAKRALYRGFRPKKHIPINLIQKYFITDDDKLHVQDNLKKFTDFKRHNLVKDPYDYTQMIDADIVFCRNVTIYFNFDTTKTIMNNIYKTMHPQGFLFIGHSETLWNINDDFTTLDFPKAFVYQKPSLNEIQKKINTDSSAVVPNLNLTQLFTSNDTLPSNLKTRSKNIDSGKTPFEEIMELDTLYYQGVLFFEKKEYDDALKCFDQITEKNSEYLLAFFAKATIYSNQGKYAKANEMLDHLLFYDNLFLEAYYLKAILYVKNKHTQEAIDNFNKVIYIDPNNCLAYYYLGNLYAQQDEINQSKRAWQNLLQNCQNKSPVDVVPLSESLTYGHLATLAERFLSNS